MKKNILITGSSGFIGKNLSEFFQNTHNLFTPNSKTLNLLDSEAVEAYITKYNFDIVIHAANYSVYRISDRDPSQHVTNSLRMFFNLVRCNKKFGKMFYFGSGAEYDMAHYIPKMKEEYFDTYVPLDDYGFAKYIAAKSIEHIPNIYDLRIFGCFGKYEDWRMRFISNACCKVLFDMDISIKQNVFFDYLYINDLARILEQFIEKESLQYQYYNICTGSTIDLYSLAKIVMQISGKNKNITISQDGLKKEYSGNNIRLKKEIPDFQFTDTNAAIKDLYNWYENNKSIIHKEQLFLDK